MHEYTEGICEDGAAILCDGKPLTITEILNSLKERDAALQKLAKQDKKHRTWERLAEKELSKTLKIAEENTNLKEKLAEMESQEPVASVYETSFVPWHVINDPDWLPLYAKPVPADKPATRRAPCEHFCEAKAFEIEIRQLKAQLASAPPHSQQSDDARNDFLKIAQLVIKLDCLDDQEQQARAEIFSIIEARTGIELNVKFFLDQDSRPSNESEHNVEK